MNKNPELCTSCNEATATRGEYCDECDRQIEADAYWEERMEWERERERLED